MFHEMEQAGLPAPEYQDNSFMLNATIRNSNVNDEKNDKSGNVNGEVNDKFGNVNSEVINTNLTKNEKNVYAILSENPTFTRSDLIENLNISARTLDRTIKSLKEKHLIARIGSDKTGHWIIL